MTPEEIATKAIQAIWAVTEQQPFADIGSKAVLRVIHEAVLSAATLHKDLLAEVIGDDDPRTFETDDQWRETLEGKDDFDHIEISIYAGTLRRILAELRPGTKDTP